MHFLHSAWYLSHQWEISDGCNVTCCHATRGSLIIFLGWESCEMSKCKFYTLYDMCNVFFASNYSFAWFDITVYHLIQLNFLHFLSIFADFWNFSHSHLKEYFPSISCLLFGIMITMTWITWIFSILKRFFGIFMAHVNIAKYCQITSVVHQKWKSMWGAY